MKISKIFFLLLLLFTFEIFAEKKKSELIKLPPPELEGKISVETTIKNRRTRREFSKEPLTIEELSQILWSAQGITDEKNHRLRAAPSAGALYPLELYVVAGENSVRANSSSLQFNKENNPPSPPFSKGGIQRGLEEGVYHYLPKNHSIEKVLEGDLRKKLASALFMQSYVAEAPVIIIISAVYERTKVKYGEAGEKYVHIEVGHTAQNIFLQGEALGLAVGVVGAGNWDEVAKILKLPSEETPLYCLPIGKRK